MPHELLVHLGLRVGLRAMLRAAMIVVMLVACVSPPLDTTDEQSLCVDGDADCGNGGGGVQACTSIRCSTSHDTCYAERSCTPDSTCSSTGFCQ